MAPLKSPGIGGLYAHFFQHNWNVVGPSICVMIQGLFNGEFLDPEFNKTAIVLIPKLTFHETFTDFRPISLYSVIYKIITKLIVHHLQPLMSSLIGPTQTSFIKGRNVAENIIINQEVIHSVESKNGLTGWMAIKFDLQKAFDRLY
ncbi:hypothetical protein HRI_000744000 [Hibiscus trionum]|uniref:Reverse transcriptase domain-containing protein n=1 Tax=Hibiscus trionum TaxID=183268 RepID=A0A9W7H487_HIBTR|nr:hypothetical protein HRI_000744000 [Hibiscus trionum]